MILELDFSSDAPIYLQIRNQIVMGIAAGQLSPGERLPTIRALADEAGVNTMTVNKAYALLKQEGYILTDRRNGATVRRQDGDGGLSEKLLMDLRLAISEAKVAGMSQASFLKLCGEIYEDTEGRK